MLYIVKEVEDLLTADGKQVAAVYCFLRNETMNYLFRFDKDEAAQLLCSGFVHTKGHDENRIRFTMADGFPSDLIARQKEPFALYVESEDDDLVCMTVTKGYPA